MSYMIDLDEYSEARLRDELQRREFARESGVCDYCGRPSASKACRFPERHSVPAKIDTFLTRMMRVV